MKHWSIRLGVMLVIAVTGSGAGAADSGTHEGAIRINARQVAIGGKDYGWTSRTECRDTSGVRMTCGTLAQVGYADRARVVVEDDTVTRIDVLVLHQ